MKFKLLEEGNSIRTWKILLVALPPKTRLTRVTDFEEWNWSTLKAFSG
jgi:hypothetical protein